jgi:uncharacterized protein YjbI with pentapeptide repeats
MRAGSIINGELHVFACFACETAKFCVDVTFAWEVFLSDKHLGFCEGLVMANPKHLAILERGVNAWNKWRLEESFHGADLSSANLEDAHLSEADLARVSLDHTNLKAADLQGAEFHQASLYGADLTRANCTRADFHQALLAQTNFSAANLTEADISETDLSEVNLSWANLSGSDFYDAFLWGATFVNNNLATAKNLDTIRHQGPSTVDIDTIYRSQGKIPERFLRGIGVPNDFIFHLRSFDWKSGYPSCFISYSSKDQEFANRLYSDLQAKGVTCWLATEDLKTGDRFPEQIEASIHRSEKLLIILSESSVNSRWVEREVRAAFEKEAGFAEKTVPRPRQRSPELPGWLYREGLGTWTTEISFTFPHSN